MATIRFSRHFTKKVKALRKRYRSIEKDLNPLIDQLIDGQVVGDKVTGAGYDVFKARVRNSDKQRGKSGGYRVIYYLVTAEEIILITIYAKSDQADISPRKIKALIQEYDRYG